MTAPLIKPDGPQGYVITVGKEGPDKDWYITVENVEVESFSMMYDGYWPESEDRTLVEAVDEALMGATLKSRSAHNQRWLDLADELEQEADDGERGGFTEDQVYQYAAQRIRQLVKEMEGE